MFFYVLRMSVCSPPLTLAFPPETEKYSKYFYFLDHWLLFLNVTLIQTTRLSAFS